MIYHTYREKSYSIFENLYKNNRNIRACRDENNFVAGSEICAFSRGGKIKIIKTKGKTV